MTDEEEKELLALTRETNKLLKVVLQAVRHDGSDDFMLNVIANIVGNRIDGGGK